MKQIQEEETRIETRTRYQCETCGAIHPYPDYINKCAICGKEFCIDCNPNAKRVSIIQDDYLKVKYDPLTFLSMLDCNFVVEYACKECKSKLISDKQYEAKLSKIVNNFKKEVKELNKEVHNGNNNK